jgi:hypothetical protein
MCSCWCEEGGVVWFVFTKKTAPRVWLCAQDPRCPPSVIAEAGALRHQLHRVETLNNSALLSDALFS